MRSEEAIRLWVFNVSQFLALDNWNVTAGD